MGFALTLQPFLVRIRDQVPSLIVNMWYLDDGTLCGSTEDLCLALEAEGPSYGLFLNRHKSLLVVPSDNSSLEDPAFSNPLPSEIPVSRGGFSLLGAGGCVKSNLSLTSFMSLRMLS